MVTRAVDLLHDTGSSLHAVTVGQRDTKALTPIVYDVVDDKTDMTAIQS